MINIPVYQPSLSGKEKEYVMTAFLIQLGYLPRGNTFKKFEEQFAAKIDVKHATTVSNGTVAIHLALLALGIGAEDEVIVLTLTYIASLLMLFLTRGRLCF